MSEAFNEYLRPLFTWVILSFSLWALCGKLGKKHRWLAWIPGLRYIAFGDAVDLDGEGLVCGIFDLLYTLLGVFDLSLLSERAASAQGIAALVLFVFLFIFRIRLFLRLLNIFGRRKLWVLLYLIASWLTLLIFALGKRFQPREDFRAHEEWEPGIAPAQIPGTEAMHGGPHSDSGLSVDLDERTVRSFGKKRYLLKDIELDIPNGSMVMLLGGSGSGKTTFVNAIIGYEKADAKVLLNGSDVYEEYDSVKYRIGFVPQQNLIRGSDTVFRTVTDAAALRMPADAGLRARNGKVREILDLLGLRAGCDGLVCKKSGGQLRRISIAMELVSDPELFVLDEPDSGLDGVIAREIFTKLRGIADDGRIVIVITHTPDRVIDLFDKVIVLARDSGRVGRLAFYGTPQEAREFFGKDTMEGIIMSVSRTEEGGDGRADEFVERYAKQGFVLKAGAAS